jgi:hypothetical protein
MLRYIKAECVDLGLFLDLRDSAVAQIASLHRKAKPRAADAEWLKVRLAAIAPTHKSVEGIAGKGQPRLGGLGMRRAAKPVLSQADGWKFHRAGKGSGIKDGVLDLRGEGEIMGHAYYRDAKLEESFEITFSCCIEESSRSDYNYFYVFFSPEPEKFIGEEIYCASFDGIRNRDASVERAYFDGKGPGRSTRLALTKLAKDTLTCGEWASVRIAYEAGSRKVAVDIAGKNLVSTTLPEKANVGRYLRISAEPGVRIQLKDLVADFEAPSDGKQE